MRAALSAVVVAMTLGQPSVVSAAITNFSKSGHRNGDEGFSWTQMNSPGNSASFVMNARSSEDNTQWFSANSLGELGTGRLKRDSKGTGGQEDRLRPASEISGGRGDEDEERILNANAPFSLDSILLKLDDIKFGHDSDDENDPAAFVRKAHSGRFKLITDTDALYMSVSAATGRRRGVFDGGSFPSGTDFTDDDGFKIRETHDHIYRRRRSQGSCAPVPTPSAMLLGGLGAVLAVWIQRRGTL